jgi:hypothetical protein
MADHLKAYTLRCFSATAKHKCFNSKCIDEIYILIILSAGLIMFYGAATHHHHVISPTPGHAPTSATHH